MFLKFPDIADPPDMISDATCLLVVPRQFASTNILTQIDGFQDCRCRFRQHEHPPLQIVEPLLNRSLAATSRARTTSGASTFGFPIIAPAEIFLQPYVKADKEISASHFSNRQLGFSRPAVTPGRRDSGPRVSTDDRFKRQLDREIKMRCN